MKILVNREGHIRPNGVTPNKWDVEVEVSEAFIDRYYEAIEEYHTMLRKLEQLCETTGKIVGGE